MTHKAAVKTTPSISGDTPLGFGGVAMAFLDTTWRIATPVILFTILGIYLDLHIGTKPWLTFVSVVLGFGAAALLVKRQLQAVEQADKTRGGKQ